ncbi:MAG: 5-formyltetrahydrofolate cyclo-ligase [Verrucomicrobia bacterium]|nr:5-formyltetrahydrofolate cyclo-ligase [Verrucomicrobiota bacterium]MCF7707468.1 5-formyltetrahydrofolate cyclo-ligase [Verrucomicrobiota bacterium]
MIKAHKHELRRRMKRILDDVGLEQWRQDSRRICEALAAHPEWINADAVMLFAPIGKEPDIWPMVESALSLGKTVTLPRFNRDNRSYECAVIRDLDTDIVRGRYGIREPAPDCGFFSIKNLDVTLVPGVAFDECGRRLGRGVGYYDRLLSMACGLKCGIGLDIQLLKDIPSEPHDIKLNCVLTPARWLMPGCARK